MTYTSYLNEPFSEDRFEPVHNLDQPITNKPKGGLWSTPTQVDGWRKFCKENRNDSAGSNPFTFELKEDTRVFNLHSVKDFYIFKEKYSTYSDTSMTVFDWEKVAEDWDVIDFEVKDLYFEMYSWDLDRILVLNRETIQPKELLN